MTGVHVKFDSTPDLTAEVKGDLQRFYREDKQYRAVVAAASLAYFADYLRLVGCHLPRGSAVLDLGCGATLASQEIARPGNRITACDLAAPRAVPAGAVDSGRLHHLIGDVLALPVGDRAVDAVTSNGRGNRSSSTGNRNWGTARRPVAAATSMRCIEARRFICAIGSGSGATGSSTRFR